ncbi:McrB family protein [Brucella intermedia]|uniref:McrB family protein n=1 Tax=Brucella intermedia TaxID=94625 RepID=UPI00124F153C|nr:AAA family ATPase [Brucella intermedia]KAB2715338.1 AAA domain-containing protein [Brucella intermedia]
MRYFDIPTIKAAIQHLQGHLGTKLITAFVFAANDVNATAVTDLSKKLGTDRLVDQYFSGALIGLAPMKRGNLLRPRFEDVTWKNGRYAEDYVIRQDTKFWGNISSSRGYREWAQRGLIEGDKSIFQLKPSFKVEFEQEISDAFRFEDFMVWLFAFTGFPDEIDSWSALYDHLVKAILGLNQFQPEYLGRFNLTAPAVPWPGAISNRPTNEEFLAQLAPKLKALIAAEPENDGDEDELPPLPDDDEDYVAVTTAIRLKESYSFLLAGPPGTGKSRKARQLAIKLAGAPQRELFLQFHPAMGYDDFVQGFRPVAVKNDKGEEVGVTYKLAFRLFMQHAEKAKSDLSNNYVVVIDELNRGDVARIFGEVLTYLEPSYRKKPFRLSYAEEDITLPSNLILIATANPYDRSVTDLDDALLRRFWVIEVEPNAATLRAHLVEKGIEPGLVNRTVQMFTIINDAMPNGFGHANFLGVRTLDDLKAVWLGRVRMGLKRSFMHDRDTFKSTDAEIEALLTTAELEEVPVEDGPPSAAGV